MQIGNGRCDEVMTVIRSCLIARKGDVTLKMLNADYAEFEGEPIPFREFQCPSLMSFLRKFQNVVQIFEKNGQTFIRPVDSEKSRHVSTLVKKQRSVDLERRSRRPYLGFCGGRVAVTMDSSRLVELIKKVKANKNGVSLEWALQHVNRFMEPVKMTHRELQCQLKEMSHEIIISDGYLYPANRRPIASGKLSSRRHQRNDFHVSSNNHCESVSKSKFNRATNENQEDLQFVNKSDKYQTLWNDRKRSADNHRRQSTTRELNTDKSLHVISLKEIQTNNSTVSQKKEDEVCSDHLENDMNCPISLKIRARLIRLIRDHHKGIWCRELPKIYYQTFEEPLDSSKLGFANIEDLAYSLPRIFHCVKPLDSSDYKLYNAEKPPPNLLDDDDQSFNENVAIFQEIFELEALPTKLDPVTVRRLLPERVLDKSETVTPISVRDLGVDDDYEEVQITKVISPSFFWVRLRQNQLKFNKFSDKLNAFYNANHDSFKVPLIFLQEGLNVVCIFEKKWMRGIVRTVSLDGWTTVHFYDCGEEKAYPKEEIYFLHRDYAYLPAQAILCGLYNVKPYQSPNWSKQVTWEFICKTSIPLIATISCINVQENSMLITLTDTRGVEDVHINDWMFDMEYGERGQLQFQNRNFPFIYYRECLTSKGYDASAIHNLRSENRITPSRSSSKSDKNSKTTESASVNKSVLFESEKLQNSSAYNTQIAVKDSSKTLSHILSNQQAFPRSPEFFPLTENHGTSFNVESFKNLLIKDSKYSAKHSRESENERKDSIPCEIDMIRVDNPVEKESTRAKFSFGNMINSDTDSVSNQPPLRLAESPPGEENEKKSSNTIENECRGIRRMELINCEAIRTSEFQNSKFKIDLDEDQSSETFSSLNIANYNQLPRKIQRLLKMKESLRLH